MKITYRQLLVAVRRAEEMEADENAASERLTELEHQNQKHLKKKWFPAPTDGALGKAESELHAVASEMDQEVDW